MFLFSSHIKNVMCDEEAIALEDNAINQDTNKLGEEFNVLLKVNLN